MTIYSLGKLGKLVIQVGELSVQKPTVTRPELGKLAAGGSGKRLFRGRDAQRRSTNDF